MAVEIPIVAGEDSPDVDLQVELDGVTYTLGLQWNERDGAWYLSISTAEGELLVAGRKVVLDALLLSRYRDARLPRGALMAIDTSGELEEPGLEDLGVRVKLLYFTEAERAAA